MAGAGFRTFVAGEVLTAAQVNTYLMEQAVMTFADATARDAAVTSPTEGMVAFLKDTNNLVAYDGSAWTNVVQKETVLFTASGTFTKANYPWARYATITCVGPGGASGGAEASTAQGEASTASGGGAGGVSIKYATVASLGASETVTVGTGGVGVSGADGGNGSGDTSFGTICIAKPGFGGETIANAIDATVYVQEGGGGGLAGTGDIVIGGDQGGSATVYDTTHSTLGTYKGFESGRGGSTMFGESSGNAANNIGTANGGGGSGIGYGQGGTAPFNQGVGSALAGSNGADGLVIVELYS
jgi:hypothetical protein